MWEFVEVARLECRFNRWEALVTLQKNGVPESFFVKIDPDPCYAHAEAAGIALAERKNAEDLAAQEQQEPQE